MNIYESTASASDSEDDPVVSELPIYHSNRLDEKLYVLQYTNDVTSSFKDGEVDKMYFKPESQNLKFNVRTNEDDSFIEENEKEVTVQAQKHAGFSNNIVVATFNGKEVHLSTVRNVFTLQVEYPNIEKPKKKKAESDTSEDEAGPSSARQITVKFQNNPKPNQKQMISSKRHKGAIENEKWVECDLVTADTTTSKVEKMKLLADYLHETNQSNNLDENTYFKHLVPVDQEQSNDEPSLPAHLISLNALKVLPLLEQCRLLLKGTQIIQFQQILLLLAGCPGLTTESLLKTLPKVAVLVRGNWVVKSEVLYPPNTWSSVCGVPADNMCRARDYLLYLFTKNQFVERKKVASIVKVPAEEIKEIFKGVSSLRHNKGWELNLDTDFDFIAKYPDIEQRQSLLWEQRFIQVCDFLKEKKRRKSRSESKSFSEDKKSGLCNSSDNDSGAEKTKSPPRKKKRTE